MVLGVPMTNKERYAAHKAAGLCTKCKSVRVPGKSFCVFHLEQNRLRSEKIKNRYMQAGLCTQCGDSRAIGLKCLKCATACSTNAKNRYHRIKGSGVCPHCGGLTEGSTVHCNTCITTQRTKYQRYKENCICARCTKNSAKENSPYCIECAAKDAEEQRIRRVNFTEHGLCGCGREPIRGRRTCQICTDMRKRLSEDRKSKGLCPTCGGSLDTKGITCVSCRNKTQTLRERWFNDGKCIACGRLKVMGETGKCCKLCNDTGSKGELNFTWN